MPRDFLERQAADAAQNERCIHIRRHARECTMKALDALLQLKLRFRAMTRRLLEFRKHIRDIYSIGCRARLGAMLVKNVACDAKEISFGTLD